MTKTLMVGVAVAALLVGSSAAAFAQSSDSNSVATASAAPLVPGGAAGEPAARGPMESFWASLTGSAHDNSAKPSQTASMSGN